MKVSIWNRWKWHIAQMPNTSFRTPKLNQADSDTNFHLQHALKYTNCSHIGLRVISWFGPMAHQGGGTSRLPTSSPWKSLGHTWNFWWISSVQASARSSPRFGTSRRVTVLNQGSRRPMPGELGCRKRKPLPSYSSELWTYEIRGANMG